MKIVASFITATTISVVLSFVDGTASFAIGLMRGEIRKDDFIFSREFSLLGGALSIAALLAYQGAPGLICPALAKGDSYGFSPLQVFLMLIVFEALMYAISVVLMGWVARQLSSNKDYFEDKPTKVFLRLLGYNVSGFSALAVLGMLLMWGRI